MKKVDFLTAIAATRTEIGVISSNVDTLLAKANAADDDVDPDIVTAYQGLQSDVDALNTKSANTPAAPAASGSNAGASTPGA